MKKTEVIQNLKCGGCANTITKSLNELPGVSNTEVDVETNSVSFEYVNEDQIETVERKLSQLGYPIDTDPNSLLKEAKSYVSCMIGRVSEKVEGAKE
ncbi:MAG: heavy-metal-associated domain-containing protein [Flavobacteriia bacterium]|jgi:copper chaperone